MSVRSVLLMQLRYASSMRVVDFPYPGTGMGKECFPDLLRRCFGVFGAGAVVADDFLEGGREEADAGSEGSEVRYEFRRELGGRVEGEDGKWLPVGKL